MATTIQISEKLKDTLSSFKMFEKQTYEEVIWDLIEDTMELKDEIKAEIEQGRKEYAEGKYVTMEQVAKELGL